MVAQNSPSLDRDATFELVCRKEVVPFDSDRSDAVLLTGFDDVVDLDGIIQGGFDLFRADHCLEVTLLLHVFQELASSLFYKIRIDRAFFKYGNSRLEFFVGYVVAAGLHQAELPGFDGDLNTDSVHCGVEGAFRVDSG